MSQGKRIIEDFFDKLSCNDKGVQSNENVVIKKPARKRGRINVNACHRCRRDKKKCDGNYSTKESCRYCRHHKAECTYPEPGRKRVKIVPPNIEDVKIKKVKETKKFKKVDTRKSPMKDLYDRIIKVEENLFDMTELLVNVRQSTSPEVKEITQQLFFRLLADEITTIEQTLLLRRLWCLIDQLMNRSSFNEEYFYGLYSKLQLLESNQEEIRSLMWEEVQNLVERCNDMDSACENEFLTQAFNSFYAAPSQIQSHPPISPEFNNNNNDGFVEFPLEKICQDTPALNATSEVIVHNPLMAQIPSPIVPSQHSPCLQAKFSNANLSHNSIPIIDNEMEYLQYLTNERTNFLQFQSAMSPPSFLNENRITTTFSNLQSSPSHHPLNEIEHQYGMLSPTDSVIDYIQQNEQC